MNEGQTPLRMSRRALLRQASHLGAFGLVVGAVSGRPAVADAQGTPRDLGPEESVDQTLRRLFGTRPIKDAGPAIKLDVPAISENGASVPLSVEVQSPMTAADHVKAIYVISDRNRRPLNAKFALTPQMGAAFVGTNVRLGESTEVRAIAELSNGTLLQAKREVRVTIGGCGY